MANFDSIAFNEASGKIGAIVFQKNGTARRRATPRNPQTDAQQAVRNGFSAASAAWTSLPPAERLGWSRLAAQVTLTNPVGKLYNPTGRRLYISCYQNARTASLTGPPAAEAPAMTPPGPPPLFVPSVPPVLNFRLTAAPPSADHPDGQLALLGNWSSGDYALVLRVTGPCSPDRSRLGPTDFRVLTAVPKGGPLPTPDALAALYQSRFVTLQTGVILYAEAFLADDNGFVGSVARAALTVGAAQSALAPAPTDQPRLKAA